MGKKKNPRPRPDAEATPREPFNPAFDALAGLRASMGDAPAAPEAKMEAAEPEPGPDRSADERSADALPPRARTLVVRREKKGRGGKTVTVVEGWAAEAELEPLARRMARALGCGGGTEGEAVILQGDQTDRAARWLEGEGADRVVKGN